MSAWSSVVALSGFHYHGTEKSITLMPKLSTNRFSSFWSSGTGWGVFSVTREDGRSRTELGVTEGILPLKSIRVGQPASGTTSVTLDQKVLAHQAKRIDAGTFTTPHQAKQIDGGTLITLDEALNVPPGGKLLIRL
jgi:hypothetical protein